MIEKNYELRRSNRRTLALTLDRQGRLIAHAPLRMPLRTIEAFILEKQDWIARKRQELSAAESRTCGFRWKKAAVFPIWVEGFVSATILFIGQRCRTAC